MIQFFPTLAAILSVVLVTTGAGNGQTAQPTGMIKIKGGTFLMGSTDEDELAHNVEKPPHQVTVSPFWMDETEVTNSQFAAFVKATGYVTWAEKDIDWEEMKKQVPPGTPKPPAHVLKAGSMVFTPPQGPVPLNNIQGWWSWVTGANWRHPEGPDSNLDGRESHPVVHISWEDANAYAKWAQKRLPTEAEWEFAARGGLKSKPFTWGEAPFSEQSPQANIWQGDFPYSNTEADGFTRTAPVKTYPPNAFGLYDMSGNVWEWCSDWWRVDLYRHRSGSKKEVVDPAGPPNYFDPRFPHEKQRVTRGGSFLCHDCYCAAYRPAGRRGTAFDTGMSHIGFRCAKSVPVETEQ